MLPSALAVALPESVTANWDAVTVKFLKTLAPVSVSAGSTILPLEPPQGSFDVLPILITHKPGVLLRDRNRARDVPPSLLRAFSNSRWVTSVPSGFRTSIVQCPCTLIPSCWPRAGDVSGCVAVLFARLLCVWALTFGVIPRLKTSPNAKSMAVIALGTDELL